LLSLLLALLYLVTAFGTAGLVTPGIPGSDRWLIVACQVVIVPCSLVLRSFRAWTCVLASSAILGGLFLVRWWTGNHRNVHNWRDGVIAVGVGLGLGVTVGFVVGVPIKFVIWLISLTFHRDPVLPTPVPGYSTRFAERPTEDDGVSGRKP
jgi:hypothetical protein